MNRNALAALLMAASSVAACQVTDTDANQSRQVTNTPEEVLFAPLVLQREGYCLVGFGVTYPKGIAPHSRQIRVTTQWSGDVVDYPLPIPPLGAPASFVDNDDGTISFQGMAADSIMDCEPELAARTLAIGPCVDGVCAPARFVPDEDLSKLGLTEDVY